MTNVKTLALLLAIGLPIAGNAQYKRTPKGSPVNSDKAVLYELERNEPENSGLFGVLITPAILDLNGMNLNLAGGFGFFYTYKSLLGISGNYRISYLDNPLGEGNEKEGTAIENITGKPVKYTKSRQFELLAKASLFSWQRDAKYHITLGSAGYRKVAVSRVEGKVVRAITLRLGYQQDSRIIENDNGIAFKTTTPALEYHSNGEVYKMEPTFLPYSSTMMNSNIIVAGIGLSTFRDIKITLDDTKYSGRRQEKNQTDVFIDLLYANKLDLQDIIYYHSMRNIPQRLDVSSTTLTKAGVRIGYQTLGMTTAHFGGKFVAEGGIRPGPKGKNIGSNSYVQLTFAFMFGGKLAF